MDLKIIADCIETIIDEIGEDKNREGLLKTPERVAEAYKFLTKGYAQDIDKVMNNAIFEEKYDEMVIVRDIDFFSLCEHHLLPFFGKVHIAYIPSGKLVGLSKLARVVEIFARRLQLQERMTVQIADAINKYLKPDGVAVVAEAHHMCMMMRGVEKQNSFSVTSSMLGSFRDDPKTRNEFLNLIAKKNIY
ncbi:MAG: GTP cyclohydrolase I FolE [Ignavibacteriales bacterium]|nr:GTP cyclohydrolase I FolE [Ignavibacteriales bacterium]